MLVTDGAGVPLGLQVARAGCAEVHLAPSTLERVQVRTPAGRLRTRLSYLVADKGYDSGRFRQYLRARRLAHCIPPIRHVGRFARRRLPRYDPQRYAQRWIIERTYSWLLSYRRVLVRHERLLLTYRAFVVLACFMIALRVLLK
jgi:transposase